MQARVGCADGVRGQLSLQLSVFVSNFRRSHHMLHFLFRWRTCSSHLKTPTPGMTTQDDARIWKNNTQYWVHNGACLQNPLIRLRSRHLRGMRNEQSVTCGPATTGWKSTGGVPKKSMQRMQLCIKALSASVTTTCIDRLQAPSCILRLLLATFTIHQSQVVVL